MLTVNAMGLRRIAQQAGVSLATVSMALRNSPKISRATKERVLRVAARLGYKPNAKITELMSRMRLSRNAHDEICLAVVSFYEDERPWRKSLHLARIYEGMTQRAEALGYRLEPLWLRAPGMTHSRFRSILDARGIQGMLCLGSPDIDEEFPTEFDHYAIVTQGLSIKTPLHRVLPHSYNDTWYALERLKALGYRRPGLAVGFYEEIRTAHANVSAYLGWCDHAYGSSAHMPVLKLDRMEEKPLLHWLKRQRPDAMVLAHLPDVLPLFSAIMRGHGIRVPEDLGVAVLSQTVEGSGFSGLQTNQWLIGAWAVELLVARITNLDLGIPNNPRIEMVESIWIDGKSLRPKQN
jgi:DNA-binding LacI/PurR family transcriptional regulator